MSTIETKRKRSFFFVFLLLSLSSVDVMTIFVYLLQMATVIGPGGRPHFVYTISGVRVEFPAKAYPSQIAMMDKVRIAVVLSDSYLISRKLLPHVQQRRLEGETVMIELTRTHGPLSKYHRHPSFYYINTQSSAAVLDMTGGRGIISCRNIAQGPGIR